MGKDSLTGKNADEIITGNDLIQYGGIEGCELLTCWG
jgi:hypothetical protein